MFTGIVEDIGFISKIDNFSNMERSEVNLSDLKLFIQVSNLDISSIVVGESIAIQGACMTVSQIEYNGFYVNVSQESLKCTVGLSSKGEVNLERSLKIGDRLGGHFVYGHVDCIGQVYDYKPCSESKELIIDIPVNFSRFLCYKGSITINGVSLTINNVIDIDIYSRISINVIPYTQMSTTLHNLKKNDFVNIEVDSISRYIDRIMSVNLNLNK
ncbi:riboflavin synthase alpha chain [Candidatus Kinetoplastibacterium desouzaii TCC079E]|uniref:Riboflavin synthase n=1 Tax=Candidatus Kinetoplastidibacterium desouzai TCC079E TaxID=1208919 RepID=M1L319_9PROT|nr:riboflavin synthase [Candidatus Kinetoplastibacterium desouzaii]AGF47148.1 riboflavin synthase alpha chain [Candidatus Kinetoplastibacterium desouzaii TCC079E]